MSKKERHEEIDRLANRFASSGEYRDWHSIEIKLKNLGFREAREQLDREFRRQELDEMCRQARRGKQESDSDEVPKE